jgi:hypothetical protein
MRFARHEREGQDKKFVAELVAGVQDPVTPVLRTGSPS